MSIHMIWNPKAGSADAANFSEAALQRKPRVILHQTHQAGEAFHLAQQAVRAGARRIIAAGGDGTVNEIVNGIAPHFDAVELALVPLGTGNDLARSLVVPTDVHAALDLALTGPATPIDVGQAGNHEQRWFLNTATGGFSGAVAQHISSAQKDRWGSLAYVASALAVLPELATYHVSMTLDAQPLEIDAYNLVIANGRYAAGGIPVAPEAMLDDGLLDLAIVPSAPLAQSVLAAIAVVAGRQTESDRVITLRASRVHVRSQPAMPFNVDGEHLGDADLTFSVLRRVLRVVIGENCECLVR